MRPDRSTEPARVNGKQSIFRPATRRTMAATWRPSRWRTEAPHDDPEPVHAVVSRTICPPCQRGRLLIVEYLAPDPLARVGHQAGERRTPVQLRQVREAHDESQHSGPGKCEPRTPSTGIMLLTRHLPERADDAAGRPVLEPDDASHDVITRRQGGSRLQVQTPDSCFLRPRFNEWSQPSPVPAAGPPASTASSPGIPGTSCGLPRRSRCCR